MYTHIDSKMDLVSVMQQIKNFIKQRTFDIYENNNKNLMSY